ncbi:MAG: NAD(P)-binding protein [Planctomycetes bacterium]|nr:NAD(P)-binding protein [Planctomycetota bacterium]
MAGDEILVVGAGFAGAVLARELADHGRTVRVIDRRDASGGNAHDSLDPRTGYMVHRYGPHIFHTSSGAVVDWLSRFTAWTPYRHRVRALVDGRGLLPVPINLDTVNGFFGTTLRTAAEMDALLAQHRVAHPVIRTARDYAESIYGRDLTELFFARYTRTMWGRELDAMPASVLSRLPVRRDSRDGYFEDSFQALPEQGYSALFRRMLDHPGIRLELGTAFAHAMLASHGHVFLSMPIDEFFGYDEGVLPYRAVRFRDGYAPVGDLAGHTVPTINLTDGGPVTRRTRWSLYPGPHHPVPGTGVEPVTDELPGEARPGEDERFYPVHAADGGGEALYRRYHARAQALQGVTFIGRCGTFRYFDMHQVVAASLGVARRHLGLPVAGEAG